MCDNPALRYMMPPNDQPPSSIASAMPKALLAGAMFLLALWPRLVGLDTFVTTDEIFWVGRGGAFARGLAEGRLAATVQTGHPGVTTMWAGLLGMGTEHAQSLAGDSRREIIRNPNFLTGLAAGRRAVAVATALSIAAISLLAWRLFGPGPALLGGALLALDPFYLAHSQLLHIDALLSSFMALALLAGLVRWLANGGRGYLPLSAVATGLALLSKSPALLLVVFLPLVALFAAKYASHHGEHRGGHRGGQLPSPTRNGAAASRLEHRSRVWSDLLLWGGLVVLTYALCWPALWVSPIETLRSALAFIGDNANPGHSALAADGPQSGALFYLVAFALRTTPLTLAGLALLLVEACVGTRGRRDGEMGGWGDGGMARGIASEPRPLRVWATLALLAYALLFALAMTMTAKSFDRYLLPAFPVFDLLAGLGLALSARRLRWLGGASLLLAAAFVLPLLFYPVASSLPYALAWYNPLAGGGPAAQRHLPVGWGEGLDQVARYLNAKPDAERLRVALPGEIYTTVLDSQFAGQVVPTSGGDPTNEGGNYFVTYIRARSDGPPLYDPRYQDWQPELEVYLAGIDYARVYDASVGIPLGATFGTLATLEGYGVDVLSTRPGRSINVKLFWRGQATGEDGRVVLSLLDGAGREVARATAPLGGLDSTRPRARNYILALPAGLAAGDYLLWVALETPTGQPIQLAGRPAALAPGAPEHAARTVLRSIQVR